VSKHDAERDGYLPGKAPRAPGVPRLRAKYVPRPFTRRALHIFLHECAHIALLHVGKKPRHVEELEPEQWAFRKMRGHGIAVPRKSVRRAKRYVAYKIRQAERRGAKYIDAKAKKFAT
jgi:hypothetical protein